MAHALRHWPRDTSHGHHSAGPPTQEASLSAITGAFKNVDLRKKILFTLAIIILYRIGSQIPTPGVDYASITKQISELTESSAVYSLINLFSGGALLQLSIFAIGIMPYKIGRAHV